MGGWGYLGTSPMSTFAASPSTNHDAHTPNSSADKTIKVWDIAARACVSTIQDTGEVWSVSWRPKPPALGKSSLDTSIFFSSPSSSMQFASLSCYFVTICFPLLDFVFFLRLLLRHYFLSIPLLHSLPLSSPATSTHRRVNFTRCSNLLWRVHADERARTTGTPGAFVSGGEDGVVRWWRGAGGPQ